MSASLRELPLRDIHLPDQISWWPPAPGWWLLLLSLGAVIALLLLKRSRHNPSVSIRAASLQELETIARKYQRHANEQRLMRETSALLRRICLSLYPREQVASLTGEAWLAFLDRTLPGEQFSHGAGRILVDGPYRPEVQLDGEALLALCHKWIEHLPVQGRQ